MLLLSVSYVSQSCLPHTIVSVVYVYLKLPTLNHLFRESEYVLEVCFSDSDSASLICAIAVLLCE